MYGKSNSIQAKINEYIEALELIGKGSQLRCYCSIPQISIHDYATTPHHHKSCHRDVLFWLASQENIQRVRNRLEQYDSITNGVLPAEYCHEIAHFHDEDEREAHEVNIKRPGPLGSPFTVPSTSAMYYANAVIHLRPRQIGVLARYLEQNGHLEDYLSQVRQLRNVNAGMRCSHPCKIRPDLCHGRILRKLAAMSDDHHRRLMKALRDSRGTAVEAMPPTEPSESPSFQNAARIMAVMTRSQTRAKQHASVLNTIEEYQRMAQKTARQLGRTMGPPCMCPMQEVHEQEGHFPYKSSCEHCVLHAAPRRQCRRIIDSSALFGSMTSDLASLGHGQAMCLISSTPSKYGTIYYSRQVNSKQEMILTDGILDSATSIGYLYPFAEPIKRSHFDGELAAEASATNLRKQGIHFTSDPGGQNGKHIGNRAAEAAVSRLTKLAATALARFKERNMRAYLWPSAMSWAAQKVTTSNIPDEATSRLRHNDIIPFGTSCLALLPEAHETTKLDGRWKRVIFLYHSAHVTKGKVVMKENGEIATTQDLRPMCDEQGKLQFNIDNLQPPPTFKHFLVSRTCNRPGCGKVRLLKAKRPRIKEDEFQCNHCQAIDCSTPESNEPYPLRKGRRNANIMICRDMPAQEASKVLHTESSQWEILEDDLEEENLRVAMCDAAPQAIYDPAYQTDIEKMIAADPDNEMYDLGTNEGTRYILVTKLLPKKEHGKPGPDKAIGREVDKFIKYDFAEYAGEHDDIAKSGIHEEAQLARVGIIVSIKHYEQNVKYHKFKCRIVFLGHNVTNFLTGRRITEYESAWVACSSMEAMRVAIIRSLLLGRRCTSVDIESAYLQTRWPKDRPEVFLIIPEAIFKFFPQHLQPPKDARKPRWKMLACMYGHTLSGKIFSDKLENAMVEHGFKRIKAEPSIWYQRSHKQPHVVPGDLEVNEENLTASSAQEHHDVMITSYVDDLITDHDNEGRTWKTLSKEFIFDQSDKPVEQHLGQRITWREDEQHTYAEIDISDYINHLINDFDNMPSEVRSLLDELGINTAPCTKSTPFYSDALRPSILNEVDPDNIPLTPTQMTPKVLKFIQEFIGRFIWGVRCGRYDMGYTTSILSSRTCSWSPSCFRAMIHLIGYLRSHQNVVQRFKCPKQTTKEDGEEPTLLIPSDADLPSNGRRPRLCAYAYVGYLSEVELNPEEQTCHLPVAFSTKSAAVICDSTPASETLALHKAGRLGLKLMPMLGDVMTRKLQYRESSLRPSIHPVSVLGDNAPSLSSSEGITAKLEFLTRACVLRACWMYDACRIGLLRLGKISTAKNPADLGTKHQPAVNWMYRIRSIGLWMRQ